MSALAWLVPIALAMGAFGLVAFLWSMGNGQYDDLDGAAERVLLDQDEDRPIVDCNECRFGDQENHDAISGPSA